MSIGGSDPKENKAPMKYDAVIIGSGIGGLTAAVLLGEQGFKVLLVEKAPAIGGALKRFYNSGLAFDSGFHFTGGLEEKEIFSDMLKILGVYPFLKENIRTVSQHFHLPFSGNHLVIDGQESQKNILKNLFPDEAFALDDYFSLLKKTMIACRLYDLPALLQHPFFELREDTLTLQQVLDQHFKNEELKAILSGACISHGTPPDEISFANHIRVAGYVMDKMFTFNNGGDDLFNVLSRKIGTLPVEVKTSCFPTEFRFENKTAKGLVLSTGEYVEMDQCLFTVHPKEILKAFPPSTFTPALIHRIEDFESSNGFFCVYGTLPPPRPISHELHLILPEPGVNQYFREPFKEQGILCLMLACHRQKITFTSMETMFYEQVKMLEGRSQAYDFFKRKKTQENLKLIEQCIPDLKEKMTPMTSATPLTFKAYLNDFDGSAYGVKQKIGQYSLLGRLRFRNVYCGGQSAVLPGIAGTMFSSFMIARQMMSLPVFDKWMYKELAKI